MRQSGVACGLGQLHPSKLRALGPATSPFLSFISASPKGWGQPPAWQFTKKVRTRQLQGLSVCMGPAKAPGLKCVFITSHYFS